VLVENASKTTAGAKGMLAAASTAAADLEQIKAPCWVGFKPMLREENYPQTVACVVDSEMLCLHATTFWAALNEYPDMEEYTAKYIAENQEPHTDTVKIDVPRNLMADWHKWITTRLRSMDRLSEKAGANTTGDE
jgi:CRP-like cAMP-binding protein